MEDETVLSDVEARVLRRCGAQVRVADTLTAAFDAFDGSWFDLVVVDLHLPDGNGESVISHVAARLEPPGIVVVSATIDAVLPKRLRALGVVVLDKSQIEYLSVAAQIVLEAPRAASAEVAALAVKLPRETKLEQAVGAFARRHRLTGQQIDILALSTSRRCNKEIALALGIAEDSVRTQWGRMRARLGLSGEGKSREEILVEFLKFALVHVR